MTARDETRPAGMWPDATEATRALALSAAAALEDAGYYPAAARGQLPVRTAYAITAGPSAVTVALVHPPGTGDREVTAELNRAAAALGAAGEVTADGGKLLVAAPSTATTRKLAARTAEALAAAGYGDPGNPDPARPAWGVTAGIAGVTAEPAGPHGLTPATRARVLDEGARALRKAGLRAQPPVAGHVLVMPAKPVLYNGKRVRFRTGQMRIWSAIIGLAGVCLIAGLYFGIWQVNWYIHIGSWHAHLFYLKPGWDGGAWWPSALGHWPDYRHYAFRDQLQPAVATILVLSLIAGPAYWARRVGLGNLAVRFALLVVLAIGLGVLGVYLRDFGLPNAWHYTFGTYVAPYTGWLGRISAFTLAWGFAMGLVLHKIWGPAGATLQGYYADRQADRARASGRIPLWVRLPLAPPVIRERVSWLYVYPEINLARPGRTGRWLLFTAGVLVVCLIGLGVVGKYLAGHGIAVPYLAPGAGS